jgi:hypothetical protein
VEFEFVKGKFTDEQLENVIIELFAGVGGEGPLADGQPRNQN